MRAQRGFVLVNALVLVGALAAAALVLLVRAEMSVQRQLAWQGAGQGEAYLDAFDALAATLLEADPGPTDHLGETWAQPIVQATLDRSRISGGVEDLQGRFNVNWLAVPEDAQAQEAFARLLATLGLSQDGAAAIRAFLSPGGPVGTAGFGDVLPRGGPVKDLRQLRALPGLTDRQFQRLEPLMAALPSDSRLNVNTAPPEVLAAWVPGLSVAQAQALAAERARRPFASVSDFLLALPPAVAADLDDTRLGTGSDWFLARARVEFEGRQLARQSILFRQPLPVGVRVDYRRPDD
ncbi:type II secretion system minor pseudopilin GspK [Mameliella alba]|nr:type II secretion system minor pseudopilin GspK [Antarctobacter heliothermus]MBY6143464.1 type II secretion system minor pseudopilin GspK [Mameliella alba]MCA0952812.1 type II secretion system minor pseudopilin GspK [Mameliella alba]